MKRWHIIWVLSCLIYASCTPVQQTTFESVATTIETQAVTENDSVASCVSKDELGEVIEHTIIFSIGSDTAWIKGQECTLPVAPFLEDGILYVPVSAVVVQLGASFVVADDVYYLNYMGNVSTLMEAYNVMLFNSDAWVMDRTPIVKDGVFCVPLKSLAQALSMEYTKSPAQNIYIVGVESHLKEDFLAAIRQELWGESLSGYSYPVLQELSEYYEVSYESLVAGAKQGILWRSDDKGIISMIWMDDIGSLQAEEYFMSHKFSSNHIYITNKGKLCSLITGEIVSDTPNEIYCQELRRATGRYMELLAATHILQDEKASQLLDGYRSAIDGDLGNVVYLHDQLSCYETELYAQPDDEESWMQLVNAARPGDFLVFSAAGAGPEYGFFNHSALIIETDVTSGMLHLLHARSMEYGVGADEEMDRLTYESFYNISYYQNYETVFLCRGGELSAQEAKSMAQNAYERFNGYQFGYGGRLGLEETNCAELVVDAYEDAGVNILATNSETRLKEVLKGNTKNLVPIPDDLLFSQNVEVLAVWKR